MKSFSMHLPTTPEAVAGVLGSRPDAAIHAGGVDLLDRMKEHVSEPAHLVSLRDLAAWRDVRIEDDGSIRLGAGVTLAALAAHDAVRAFLPSLADAAGQAASPQIRHRATLAGNIAQHTRCGYYRHESFPCAKRGADRCPVLAPTGVQESAAIFPSDVCASAHPSSVAPVLGSLDAVAHLWSPRGARDVALETLWRVPVRGRAADLDLAPDELILSFELPSRTRPQRMAYEEVRQKAAFDWPLVSVAVRLEIEGDRIAEARIVAGSVAPTPRRLRQAEDVLVGKPIQGDVASQAAREAGAGARPLAGNAYKVRLLEVAVRRALESAMGEREVR